MKASLTTTTAASSSSQQQQQQPPVVVPEWSTGTEEGSTVDVASPMLVFRDDETGSKTTTQTATTVPSSYPPPPPPPVLQSTQQQPPQQPQPLSSFPPGVVSPPAPLAAAQSQLAAVNPPQSFHSPPQPQPQAQPLPQAQAHAATTVLMDHSVSTQVGELVEREVGKLTRQSRMLLEGPPEVVATKNTTTTTTTTMTFPPPVEESKYEEEDAEQPDTTTGMAATPTNTTTTNNTNTNDTTMEIPLLDRSEIMAGTLLGNGAFSEVYQIWGFELQDQDWQRESRQALQDTAMMSSTGNCRYVLKHLRNALTQDKTRFVHAASDLVMEALFLSKLHHENIITLRGTSRGIDTFDTTQHDGFFLILDRLDCTLSDKIGQWARHASCRRKIYSRNLWDYAEKMDLALQIARGLDYLHDRDILYRDLKPDNIGILVTNGKQVVKIFDFGLCRELPEECPVDTKVFHMSGVGTRRYMAPEIFLTQHYNLKVDVYSFSIVLHCMLSLVRPFEKYNAHLHTLLVCKEGVRPHIPHEWPTELQTLLRFAWAHHPNDRPSMKQVRQTLERLQIRIQQEGIPPINSSSKDPLLMGSSASPSSRRRSQSRRLLPDCNSALQPFRRKAVQWWKTMEREMVQGNATSYPVHQIQSTTAVQRKSPPRQPPNNNNKKETAHFRSHLRSKFL